MADPYDIILGKGSKNTNEGQDNLKTMSKKVSDWNKEYNEWNIAHHNKKRYSDDPEEQAKWERYANRDNDSIYPPDWPYSTDFDEPALEEEYDPVDNPAHYQLFGGEKEVIDLIRDRLSYDEFFGYIKGNAIKYHMRMGLKDDIVQDAKKLAKYIEWLIELEEEEEEYVQVR